MGNQGFKLERFFEDTADHKMEVIRDDGVHRHLRFKKPGTLCYYFDVITWPGYLCYTGDMGTYVFQRLNDMLQFFRRSEDQYRYQIDFGYWAEKLEASDRVSGYEEFSKEVFAENVKYDFEQYTEDAEDWPDERKARVWQELEDVVKYVESEAEAWDLVYKFESDGFRFTDWEYTSREYTYRFLWCCYALAWAVSVYDKSKVPG